MTTSTVATGNESLKMNNCRLRDGEKQDNLSSSRSPSFVHPDHHHRHHSISSSYTSRALLSLSLASTLMTFIFLLEIEPGFTSFTTIGKKEVLKLTRIARKDEQI